jgi:hypothetical protein
MQEQERYNRLIQCAIFFKTVCSRYKCFTCFYLFIPFKKVVLAGAGRLRDVSYRWAAVQIQGYR